MTAHFNKLSKLMKMSWEIQRTKKRTRSKALQAAWAIITNEEITVQYLVRKLNRDKPVTLKTERQFALFNQ